MTLPISDGLKAIFQQERIPFNQDGMEELVFEPYVENFSWPLKDELFRLMMDNIHNVRSKKRAKHLALSMLNDTKNYALLKRIRNYLATNK